MEYDLKTKLLERLVFYGKDLTNPKFATSNKNTIKHWFDCFNQCNDFQRCQETFNHLEVIALNKQSQKAPTIANFKYEYRRQNAAYNTELIKHSCKLCNLGWREAIEGGYYSTIAILCLKTMNNATLRDRNGVPYPKGHIFPYYGLRSIPCNCPSGKKISATYHDLSNKALDWLYDNSFENQTKAHDFLEKGGLRIGYSNSK